MTDSQRVPGYPMRYIGAKNLDEDMDANLHRLDVDGDGERGIQVRSAAPEDAKRRGRRKPSPLI
ncbi:MAG: hypothetical protein K6T83_23175 [Alicyclobacillus sp.]|nr:hypothetical protein [Alicyclobacillus sp.]